MKIQIKALAEEARIIHREEKRRRMSKIKYRDFKTESELHWHRVFRCRQTARVYQLAYALLRGKQYSDVEPKTRAPLSLRNKREVQRIVNRAVIAEESGFNVYLWADPIAAYRKHYTWVGEVKESRKWVCS